LGDCGGGLGPLPKLDLLLQREEERVKHKDLIFGEYRCDRRIERAEKGPKLRGDVAPRFAGQGLKGGGSKTMKGKWEKGQAPVAK